jgi:serine/threonine protein kinase
MPCRVAWPSVTVWLAGVRHVRRLRTVYFGRQQLTRRRLSLSLCVQITEYPSPELPADRFSPELCDLVARCLEKDPKQRLTAEQLLSHPFIMRYRDAGDAEVAALLQVRQREAGGGAGWHKSVGCVMYLCVCSGGASVRESRGMVRWVRGPKPTALAWVPFAA